MEQQRRRKRTIRSRITPQWSTVQQRTLERPQCSLGSQGWNLEPCSKGGVWEGGQGKGHPGKGGTHWLDGVSPQGGLQDGGHGKQYLRTLGHPSSSCWKTNKPGLELQNSFGALGETNLEEEIPFASCDDFPSISREFECERKDAETEEGSAEKIPNNFQKGDDRRTRTTSTHPGGRQ